MRSGADFFAAAPERLRAPLRAALYGEDGQTQAGSHREAAVRIIRQLFTEELRGRLCDAASLASLVDENTFACCVALLLESIPRPEDRRRRRREK